MWFSYASETTWIPLSVAEAIKIIELNKKGIKPKDLIENVKVDTKPKSSSPITQEFDLEKIDSKYSIKKKKKKKKPLRPSLNQGDNTNNVPNE